METISKTGTRGRGWYLAFLVSWLGILAIPFYNAAEPTVGGFPMFYWYQLALVVVSAGITWVVHIATRAGDEQQAEEML